VIGYSFNRFFWAAALMSAKLAFLFFLSCSTTSCINGEPYAVSLPAMVASHDTGKPGTLAILLLTEAPAATSVELACRLAVDPMRSPI
jgi:hypothetical protein